MTDVERRDVVVVSGNEAVEIVLGEGVGLASVLVEAGGDPVGGSAVDEGFGLLRHTESQSHIRQNLHQLQEGKLLLILS